MQGVLSDSKNEPNQIVMQKKLFILGICIILGFYPNVRYLRYNFHTHKYFDKTCFYKINQKKSLLIDYNNIEAEERV